jgi:NADP-dependent 3-hydroxy acid dehydrogenase YdfG
MTAPRSLTDTVVIVTGATSGIGWATVEELVKLRVRVTAVGRRKDRLDKLVATHGAERVLPLAVDVRTSEGNKRVVADTIAHWGRLDSVVINAGMGIYGSILQASDSEVVEMLETNLHSTIWAIRSAVPELLGRGGGDIVVVASVAGLRGGPHEAVYAATKFGQVGLAGAVDRELHSKGVRVTTICPAAVATEFAIGTGRTENMPEMAGWLQADDVARSIVFTLQQPRTLRTTQLVLWSASESS